VLLLLLAVALLLKRVPQAMLQTAPGTCVVGLVRLQQLTNSNQQQAPMCGAAATSKHCVGCVTIVVPFCVNEGWGGGSVRLAAIHPYTPDQVYTLSQHHFLTTTRLNLTHHRQVAEPCAQLQVAGPASCAGWRMLSLLSCTTTLLTAQAC
jgi:hypothetical protein